MAPLPAVLVYLVSMIAATSAYPTGAPASACLSMLPAGHYGINAQTSASPFRVRVSKSTYSPSETLTITLDSSSGAQFKGFLLEARTQATDQSIGTFTAVTGSKTVTDAGCGGITHTDRLAKGSTALQWTAPSENRGSLIFFVTFVQNYTTFWVKVSSAEIGFRQPALPTTTRTTTRVQTALPTTTRTTTTREPAPLQRIPLQSDCGTNTSCFVNCDYNLCYTHVTWDVLEDTKEILFHMRSIFYGNNNKWMAVGFSQDYQMGSDSVVECVYSGGIYRAFSSYNSNYKYNTRENTDPNAVRLQSASMVGNEFFCSVLRKLNTTGNFVAFDLRQKAKWYLLFAQGETSDTGVKIMHNLRSWDAPFSSSVYLDLDYPQLLGRITVSGGTNTVGSFAVLLSSLLMLIIH